MQFEEIIERLEPQASEAGADCANPESGSPLQIFVIASFLRKTGSRFSDAPKSRQDESVGMA
ncbi:hypothetical protein [Sphingomonas colocasiae]|uniref:Transposase n=1 Tax=Sphingomonas colocasiae TaxID=1848973 RepID=A0ABS7PSG3_9SPHN|nr:hypothetical protein [Sphingomonas colocasiae]MBY8824116.1 hypothetical protein [Sphingomonas colocasiae]